MWPNCSDQEYGTGSYPASPSPGRLAAITFGACMAMSQCSKRSRRPYRRDQNDAQSPAANTPGADARRLGSTATPLSRSRPEPASQPTAGRTPTAVTTSSASIQSPPDSASPPSSTDSTSTEVRSSTPAASYQGTVRAPTSAPIAAASGVGPP